MTKVIFILTFLTMLLLFLTLACSSDTTTISDVKSIGEEDSDGSEQMSMIRDNVEMDTCLSCQRFYSNFPSNKVEFDSLYEYSDERVGIRYGRESEDFSHLVKCFRSCYDSITYRKALMLGASIEFTADGPNVLKHHLTKYSMDRPELFTNVQRYLSLTEKKDIATYFLQGISPNDKFKPEVCDFLTKSYSEPEVLIFLKEECPPAQ